MGIDKIDITNKTRVYSQGKFRNLIATSGATANLAIMPQAGFSGTGYAQWMDIEINTWSNTGTYYKEWVESSSTLGLTPTLHIV